MTDDANRVEKVTAFITRTSEGDREVLVFKHPEAGIQLPAGTVEPRETLEAAVLREAGEETGITALWLVKLLASQDEPLPPDHRMLSAPVHLLLSPTPFSEFISVPMGGGLTVEKMSRGATCRLLSDESTEGYCRIAFDLFDLKEGELVLSQSTEGWVPEAALTESVRRHHFQLETTCPTPQRWIQDGDVPGCELFWIPLSSNAPLVAPQDRWLSSVIDRLT